MTKGKEGKKQRRNVLQPVTINLALHASSHEFKLFELITY